MSMSPCFGSGPIMIGWLAAHRVTQAAPPRALVPSETFSGLEPHRPRSVRAARTTLAELSPRKNAHTHTPRMSRTEGNT
jgi:hypothetical protein